MLTAFSTAASAQQTSTGFEVVAGYPIAPDKAGFDPAIDINPGFETGSRWTPREDKMAQKIFA